MERFDLTERLKQEFEKNGLNGVAYTFDISTIQTAIWGRFHWRRKLGLFLLRRAMGVLRVGIKILPEGAQ